ncbi:MAG: zinc-ribbon domain-containing protein [Peptoanaerobacter stomatis]|uniref:zinc ribbon domain-containing protein n=1 Tax=Peptoanaerobacter stomatis TaxID=796937 RepID=UPI003F9FE4EF
MFTNVLRILIYLMVLVVLAVAGLVSSAIGYYNSGMSALVFIIVVILGVSLLCVIGTFMEMSVSLKNIEKILNKMQSNSFNANSYVGYQSQSTAELSKNNSSDMSSMIKCKSCGADVNADKKFCPKCGDMIS